MSATRTRSLSAAFPALLPGLLTATLVASAIAAPTAGAATRSSHAKGKAKATHVGRGKTKGRARHGHAARALGTTGPLLHTVGTGHFNAPEGDAFIDETWVEYGDQRRAHYTIENLLDESKSIEEWDSDADWVNVGYDGRLDASVTSRFDPVRDVYCQGTPGSPKGPWPRDAWAAQLASDRAAERQQIQLVDAMSHDDAALALLPAGPIVDGRATKLATIPSVRNAQGQFVTMNEQYAFDAQTGDVLRWIDSGGYGYTDYSTWELLPAGSDATPVTLPDVVEQAAARCH